MTSHYLDQPIVSMEEVRERLAKGRAGRRDPQSIERLTRMLEHLDYEIGLRNAIRDAIAAKRLASRSKRRGPGA